MQVLILDGNAQLQTVVWQAPATPGPKPANGNAQFGAVLTVADQSGTIVATGASQTLMLANPNRSGWMLQNNSQAGNFIFVNDLGLSAAFVPGQLPLGAFAVPPGGIFPPPGYVISTGDIEISGVQGDEFTAREW